METDSKTNTFVKKVTLFQLHLDYFCGISAIAD